MTTILLRTILFFGLSIFSTLAADKEVVIDFIGMGVSSGSDFDIKENPDDDDVMAIVRIQNNTVYFENLSQKPLKLRNVPAIPNLIVVSKAPVVFENKLSCRETVSLNVEKGCTFQDGLEISNPLGGLKLEGGIFVFSGTSKIPHITGKCEDIKIISGGSFDIKHMQGFEVVRTIVNQGAFSIEKGVLTAQTFSNMQGGKFSSQDLLLNINKDVFNRGDFSVDRLRFSGNSCNFLHFDTGTLTVSELCQGNVNKLHLKGPSQWKGATYLCAKEARFEAKIDAYCMNVHTSNSLYIPKSGFFTIGKHLSLGTDKSHTFEGSLIMNFDPTGVGKFSRETQKFLNQLPKGIFFHAKDRLGQHGVVKAETGRIEFIANKSFSDLDGFTQTGVFKKDNLNIITKNAELFGKIVMDSDVTVIAKNAVLEGNREGSGSLLFKIEDNLKQLNGDRNTVKTIHVEAGNVHLAGQNHTSQNQSIKADCDVIFAPTSNTKAANLQVIGDTIRDESGATTEIKETLYKHAKIHLETQEESTSSAQNTSYLSDGTLKVGGDIKNTEVTHFRGKEKLTLASSSKTSTETLHTETNSPETFHCEAGHVLNVTKNRITQTKGDQIIEKGTSTAPENNTFISTDGNITILDKIESTKNTALSANKIIIPQSGGVKSGNATQVQAREDFVVRGTLSARHHDVRASRLIDINGGTMHSQSGFSFTALWYVNRFGSVTSSDGFGVVNADYGASSLFSTTTAKHLEFNTPINMTLGSRVRGSSSLTLNSLINASFLSLAQSNNYTVNTLLNINEAAYFMPWGIFGGNAYALPSFDGGIQDFGVSLGRQVFLSSLNALPGKLGVLGKGVGFLVNNAPNQIKSDFDRLLTMTVPEEDTFRPSHLVKKLGQAFQLGMSSKRLYDSVEPYATPLWNKLSSPNSSPGGKDQSPPINQPNSGGENHPPENKGDQPPQQDQPAQENNTDQTPPTEVEPPQLEPDQFALLWDCGHFLGKETWDATKLLLAPTVTINAYGNYDGSFSKYISGQVIKRSVRTNDRSTVAALSFHTETGSGSRTGDDYTLDSTINASGDFTIGGKKHIHNTLYVKTGGHLHQDGSLNATTGGDAMFVSDKGFTNEATSKVAADGKAIVNAKGNAIHTGTQSGKQGAYIKADGHAKMESGSSLTSSNDNAELRGKLGATTDKDSTLKGGKMAIVYSEQGPAIHAGNAHGETGALVQADNGIALVKLGATFSATNDNTAIVGQPGLNENHAAQYAVGAENTRGTSHEGFVEKGESPQETTLTGDQTEKKPIPDEEASQSDSNVDVYSGGTEETTPEQEILPVKQECDASAENGSPVVIQGDRDSNPEFKPIEPVPEKQEEIEDQGTNIEKKNKKPQNDGKAGKIHSGQIPPDINCINLVNSGQLSRTKKLPRHKRRHKHHKSKHNHEHDQRDDASQTDQKVTEQANSADGPPPLVQQNDPGQTDKSQTDIKTPDEGNHEQILRSQDVIQLIPDHDVISVNNVDGNIMDENLTPSNETQTNPIISDGDKIPPPGSDQPNFGADTTNDTIPSNIPVNVSYIKEDGEGVLEIGPNFNEKVSNLTVFIATNGMTADKDATLYSKKTWIDAKGPTDLNMPISGGEGSLLTIITESEEAPKLGLTANVTDFTLHSDKTPIFTETFVLNVNNATFISPELPNIPDAMEQTGGYKNFHVTDMMRILTTGHTYFDRSIKSASKHFILYTDSFELGEDVRLSAPGILELHANNGTGIFGPGARVKAGLFYDISASDNIICKASVKKTYWDTDHTKGAIKTVKFKRVKFKGGEGVFYPYTDPETGEETLRRMGGRVTAGNKIKGTGVVFQAIGDVILNAKKGVYNYGKSVVYLEDYEKDPGFTRTKRKYYIATKFLEGAIISEKGKLILRSDEGKFCQVAGLIFAGDGIDNYTEKDIKLLHLKGKVGKVTDRDCAFLTKLFQKADESMFQKVASTTKEGVIKGDVRHVSKDGKFIAEGAQISVPGSHLKVLAKKGRYFNNVKLKSEYRSNGWQYSFHFPKKLKDLYPSLSSAYSALEQCAQGKPGEAARRLIPKTGISHDYIKRKITWEDETDGFIDCASWEGGGSPMHQDNAYIFICRGDFQGEEDQIWYLNGAELESSSTSTYNGTFLGLNGGPLPVGEIHGSHSQTKNNNHKPGHFYVGGKMGGVEELNADHADVHIHELDGEIGNIDAQSRQDTSTTEAFSLAASVDINGNVAASGSMTKIKSRRNQKKKPRIVIDKMTKKARIGGGKLKGVGLEIKEKEEGAYVGEITETKLPKEIKEEGQTIGVSLNLGNLNGAQSSPPNGTNPHTLFNSTGTVNLVDHHNGKTTNYTVPIVTAIYVDNIINLPNQIIQDIRSTAQHIRDMITPPTAPSMAPSEPFMPTVEDKREELPNIVTIPIEEPFTPIVEEKRQPLPDIVTIPYPGEYSGGTVVIEQQNKSRGSFSNLDFDVEKPNFFHNNLSLLGENVQTSGLEEPKGYFMNPRPFIWFQSKSPDEERLEEEIYDSENPKSRFKSPIRVSGNKPSNWGSLTQNPIVQTYKKAAPLFVIYKHILEQRQAGYEWPDAAGRGIILTGIDAATYGAPLGVVAYLYGGPAGGVVAIVATASGYIPDYNPNVAEQMDHYFNNPHFYDLDDDFGVIPVLPSDYWKAGLGIKWLASKPGETTHWAMEKIDNHCPWVPLGMGKVCNYIGEGSKFMGDNYLRDSEVFNEDSPSRLTQIPVASERQAEYQSTITNTHQHGERMHEDEPY